MEFTKLDISLGSIIVVLILILVYFHLKGSNGTDPKTSLGIKELIDSVKRDLVKSEEGRIARKEAPLFNVEYVDLEIKFVVGKTVTEKGQVELKVVTADAEKTTNTELVQTIKLHMATIPAVAGESLPNSTPVNTGPAPVIEVQ